MVLHVTDRVSLEQSGVIFQDIGILFETEAMDYLANRAGYFVENVLEYNPDATEQLDLRDKHLSCVENLGSQVRKKISSLLKSQNDMCETIGKVFEHPHPYWFRGILTGIAGLIDQMNPAASELKITKLGCILEYIPGRSTPFKRYFAKFEQSRADAERVINALNRSIVWLKKNAGIFLSQADNLKDLSISLARAIRLGLLIDQTLCETLTYEVPLGDPREKFIADELLCILRKRVEALHLQMELNRQSLFTMEIINRNSLELMHGFEQNREAIIKLFNVGNASALALTRRRLVQGPLKISMAEPESVDSKMTPDLCLENLEQCFKDLLSVQDDLKIFLHSSGSVIRQTLENLSQLHKTTETAFTHMKLSSINALGDDIVDM